MQVFKFGGASVKDAQSIQNVTKVLEQVGFNQVVMVVSAMGKTTNALEEVVSLYQNKGDYEARIHEIHQAHVNIIQELFESNHAIFSEVQEIIDELIYFLKHNKSTQYNFVYDQVVSVGELISTKIVSAYLNLKNLKNNWLDAREYIKTDSINRDAGILWDKTITALQTLDKTQSYVIQGFIGADPNGFTTTLGREGSDYTASIIAYSIEAQDVTIWKDVAGVLNADPRYFEKTVLLHEISYTEAIELAYYGASVIHPKTLQPLQNKSIPLYVKSFVNPKEAGTSVRKGQPLNPLVPCYIVKKNQYLLKVSSLDFSFIIEKNISDIIKFVADCGLKINLIQNSAISFILCVDDKFQNISQLTSLLEPHFRVEVENNVTLYTIRHYIEEELQKFTANYNVLLTQKIKETAQIVVTEEK